MLQLPLSHTATCSGKNRPDPLLHFPICANGRTVVLCPSAPSQATSAHPAPERQEANGQSLGQGASPSPCLPPPPPGRPTHGGCDSSEQERSPVRPRGAKNNLCHGCSLAISFSSPPSALALSDGQATPIPVFPITRKLPGKNHLSPSATQKLGAPSEVPPTSLRNASVSLTFICTVPWVCLRGESVMSASARQK